MTEATQNDSIEINLSDLPDYNTAIRTMTLQPNQRDVKIVMPQYLMEKPKTYLLHSILNTLCCCFCIGIAATVFSVKTNEAIKYGNYQEAAKFSKKALSLNQSALWTGLIILITWLFLSGYYNLHVINK